MAVEARHHNLFPAQLLSNREIMNPVEANDNFYNTQMVYGLPLSGTTTAETLFPMYNSVITDSIPQKPAIKANSTLTYNNLPLPRKRSRDSINPLLSYPSPQNHKTCAPFPFLGHDISLQIQQQQLNVDLLISQHMERVRMEIEEKRKREARRILEVIEEGVMKKLRAKEEEIEKIGKMNLALEDRCKTLCIENQIWRDLAQTKEATANALRANLEQILAAQVNEERTRGGAGLEEALIDDAQSCCGSSWEEELDMERRMLAAGEGGEGKWVQVKDEGTTRNRLLCRNCGKEESCVLMLPCRHLCLCTVCGSSLHTCPICKSTKTASVHVNMS